MALYCDAATLLQFFDERQVRDLLSDTGQPAPGDLADDEKLAEALKAASGRLEAACLVSEHYTTAELATMSENSLALAAEICSALVMGILMRRRFGRVNAEQVKAITQWAEDYLQQLRNGARLFDVGKHAEAGKPELKYSTPAQIQNQNGITVRTQNFYPSRSGVLPINRGG